MSALEGEQGRACIASRQSTHRGVEAWLDEVIAEHARASHLVTKLDQPILAQAVRSDQVPQDPHDEPASALLNCPQADNGGDAAASMRRRTHSI